MEFADPKRWVTNFSYFPRDPPDCGATFDLENLLITYRLPIGQYGLFVQPPHNIVNSQYHHQPDNDSVGCWTEYMLYPLYIIRRQKPRLKRVLFEGVGGFDKILVYRSVGINRRRLGEILIR